jgi:hypothetical protein
VERKKGSVDKRGKSERGLIGSGEEEGSVEKRGKSERGRIGSGEEEGKGRIREGKVKGVG